MPKYFPSITPNSFADIIKSDLRSIASMRRDGLNIEPLTDYIELVISNVFGFYNEDLTPTVQKNLLEQVLKLGYFMNGADIKLFEANCLAGYYELRFRLTAPVFLDWLKEYQFQRMEAFESSNLKAKIEIEKQPISEKTTEMLKKLAETVKPKPSELLYSTDTSREEQQAKELQKHLTKEFDYLWEKQGKNEFDRGRGKYVFHKAGSQMLPDYLKVRFREIYEKLNEDYDKLDKFEYPVSLEEFLYEQVNKIIK